MFTTPARAAAILTVSTVLLSLTTLLVGQAATSPSPASSAPVDAAEDPQPKSDWIVINHGGTDHGYATPQVTITQDGTLWVQNLDHVAHTVTSVAEDGAGDPLFDVQANAGQTKAIPAASTLAAGDYAFFCKFHPTMRGTLTVEGDSGGVVPEPPSFDLPLVRPRVERDRNIRLRMRRNDVRVMPTGPRTQMWTYGGSWPGPTIRRPAGRETRVTLVNDLPRKAGPMTMHLHGDHHAARHDGQPERFLVRRGRPRTYEFPLTHNGRPEPGSFFWYHDHRMDRTTRNNWRGLQGMFIVDDPTTSLRLPKGARDVPLLVGDRSFTADNQLAGVRHAPMTHLPTGMAWTGPHAPPNDATVGDRILVNGRFRPYLDVTATRYRLRLLNASAFSAYNFQMSDGRPFVQVGTGNGLLRKPVVRDRILLGPSQRADVVVDFHGAVGQKIELLTVPRPDGAAGTGSRTGWLTQFRVNRTADDPSRVPGELPAPAKVKPPTKVAKTWRFSLRGEPETGSWWAVNGRPYDSDRVDYRVKLGALRRWRLVNHSEMTHYVHIHAEQWTTVSRNGGRPRPWERGLEDTWKLDPGESVEVATRFTDYTGVFMVHCHMLDHEDHGMMARFKVYRPRSG